MHFFLVTSFMPTRSMPAGKHKVETHFTVLELGIWWEKSLYGNLTADEWVYALYSWSYLNTFFCYRYTKKYTKELLLYTNLRDSIADFETNLPRLARNSRLLNKLAKVVSMWLSTICNLIIISLYAFTLVHRRQSPRHVVQHDLSSPHLYVKEHTWRHIYVDLGSSWLKSF